MVKKIMRDPLFLAQKSTDATEADQQVITDLLDTLRANLDHCVGMAANMIGVKKNIIVVAAGPFQFAMVNTVITKKTGAFIIKVSTTGMSVSLKADLRFPIFGQLGHGDRIIQLNSYSRILEYATVCRHHPILKRSECQTLTHSHENTSTLILASITKYFFL